MKSLKTAILLATSLAFAAGCREREPAVASDETAKPPVTERIGRFFGVRPRIEVPSGTALRVRLTSTVDSDRAHAGDGWSGVVVSSVRVRDHEVIPAGTPVRGVVTGAREAHRGTRARLDLAVRSVSLDGRRVAVSAGAPAVIAKSPRARNLGAIAGGTAAGALIGGAVGGDGHGALVGGLVGGAAATGAVAASKGYQVVLPAGTVMVFSLEEPVAIRV